MDKSSSLGMPMSPQELSKKYKRQSLGMPRSIPIFIIKVSGHFSMRYIFITSYDMCYSWSVFIFVFSFLLFCSLQYMVGSQHICFGEDTLHFNCIEHSSFHPYCSTSVPIFLVLRLALVFYSYYVKSLFSFLYLCLISSLYFVVNYL